MRFPTILPFVFASIGLVRAEDFRELFTIPAGDDMATFEADASYHVLAQPCWSQLLLVSSLSVSVHVNLVAPYNLRTMPLPTPSLIRTQTPKLRARGIEFLDLAVLERICG
ncbi:hypothetical protein C8J57DRAFT_1518215 [Mycena rebaudengoi]|nr:hypothetical protein C8J57DRAFT_1518215 [Mycena rebaudengoi]